MRLIDGDELCNHAMRNRPKVYHDIVDMVLDIPPVKSIRTVIPLNTYERLLALADKELIEVLQKIRQEIEQEKDGYPPSADEYMAINRVIKIVDNHIKEITNETDQQGAERRRDEQFTNKNVQYVRSLP